MGSIDLTDHFLIAMPAMADPYFAKALIYVAEHNDRGCLGIIINRPVEMKLGALLERIDVSLEVGELADQPVFFGGPVQTERGFVLHRPVGEWKSTLAVNRSIGLTTSRDVLQAAAHREGPREMLVTLGYSGWGAGQLENEVAQNAWLTVPADPHIIFGMPCEERLSSAMELLGVDLANLADHAGHA